MYLIWVVAVLAMLAGAQALIARETAPATPAPGVMSLAQNMAAYRAALVTYALAHPDFAGSVPDAGVTPDPLWRNYVAPNAGYAGSVVVVYAASASASALRVVPEIEALAQGSALAGAAQGGSIVSPGNPAVPLPTAIAAAVPQGAPVWMAQAYE
ncbi:type IV pilus biogenesis protein PilM [Paraburkholderia sp. Ac-20340]|uniref:type IV pilus biogenesis protein PilM n=1 Tax=Paraburkholderia sp. Ac-20340 TaxID=2703888 RepID=UPI00197CF7F7|nr:type IV pilus biogenesis protein PilM [Paraburkholderia sp. Ac-20340]MBN3853198.1 type IV pilus biogenesis protein PilM [Paraburkholderia sp. Ac-20340]